MARFSCILALLVATGCELEGKSLGKRLAPGREISDPGIVWVGTRPVVLFDVSIGNPQQYPQNELQAVPFDGADPAQIVGGGFSSLFAWAASSGHIVAQGQGTILVYDLESATVVRSIAGQFLQRQGDTLLYVKTDGISLTRVPSGDEQEICAVADISHAWFAPSERFYFSLVGGAFGAIDQPGATPNMSSRLVQDFVVSPDERVAVVRDLQDVQDSQPNEPIPTVYRVLELPSYRELMTLPLRNRYCSDCGWLGFSPDGGQFFYAESSEPESGLIYQYEVKTNQVLSVATRAGLDSTDLLWSPSGDLALVGESQCQPASYQPVCQDSYRSTLRAGPVVEPISTLVAGATFSADGSTLTFLDALESGRLLVTGTSSLSPDPAANATVLSPPGSLVDGATFDAATGTAVFWAEPDGGKSTIQGGAAAERANLYAAFAPAFQVRRLAEAADAVAVGDGVAIANVRFSPQDLTGDLVLYDLHSGQERTLAAPVSSFWVARACPDRSSPSSNWKWGRGWGWRSSPTRSADIVMPPGCPADAPLLVTFAVRGRVPSDKDGLWALTVQP